MSCRLRPDIPSQAQVPRHRQFVQVLFSRRNAPRLAGIDDAVTLMIEIRVAPHPVERVRVPRSICQQLVFCVEVDIRQDLEGRRARAVRGIEPDELCDGIAIAVDGIQDRPSSGSLQWMLPMLARKDQDIAVADLRTRLMEDPQR